MMAAGLLTAAAEQIDNDARLPVIIIMRRSRPQRTWRQIARRLRMSRCTVYRLARKSGIT
jgi:hypothetical protein